MESAGVAKGTVTPILLLELASNILSSALVYSAVKTSSSKVAETSLIEEGIFCINKYCNKESSILRYPESCSMCLENSGHYRSPISWKTYRGAADRIIQCVWLLHLWESLRNSQLGFRKSNHVLPLLPRWVGYVSRRTTLQTENKRDGAGYWGADIQFEQVTWAKSRFCHARI